MQKLIPLLSLLFLFTAGCNQGVPVQPLENPLEYTTEEIQDMKKEIVIVSLDRDVVYIFDENNLVRYKIVNMYKPGDRMILIPLHVVLIFAFLITTFLVFVFNKLR